MTTNKSNEGVVTNRQSEESRTTRIISRQERAEARSCKVIKTVNSILSLRKPHHSGDGVNFFESLRG